MFTESDAEAFAAFELVAVEEVSGGHAAFAFELDFVECQNAGVGAADEHEVAADDEFAGLAVECFVGDMELVGDQFFAAEGGVGSGPGLESAPAVVELGGGAGEVHEAVFAGKDGCEGGLGVVLRLRVEGAFGQFAQGADHKVGANGCKILVDVDGGFFVADGDSLREEHVAGVETGVEAHGGDARDGFAAGNGPLDGGGSPVLG